MNEIDTYNIISRLGPAGISFNVPYFMLTIYIYIRWVPRNESRTRSNIKKAMNELCLEFVHPFYQAEGRDFRFELNWDAFIYESTETSVTYYDGNELMWLKKVIEDKLKDSIDYETN